MNKRLAGRMPHESTRQPAALASDSITEQAADALAASPRVAAQRQRIAQLQAPAQAAPAGAAGLPEGLRSGIEQLSGMDMSGVRVHRNSARPAQLNALAYAQGDDIHLGPGQEGHLPHEAWHLVQQRQGRVQATTAVAGVGVNDSPGLEREADRMGAQALQARGRASDGSPQQQPQALGPAQRRQPDAGHCGTTLQRKLLYDPGTVSYALDSGGEDYAFIGKWRSNGVAYYVRYGDLHMLKTVAAQIWHQVKQTYGNSGNLKKIKEGEESGDFSGAADLAPGEEAYEAERRSKTTLYLIGSHAPGKDDFRPLIAEHGSWAELQFYRANDEDDDKASTMIAVPATELAADYDNFSHLLTDSMLAQGEPLEKSVGGSGDRTALARGKVFVGEADRPRFSWDAADNPYKEMLESPSIDSADDLCALAAQPGSVSFTAGGIPAVYTTAQPSKARTGRNFYVAGKPYTASQLDDKHADAEITAPWELLKAKAPTEQNASTFTRKDRGKGQADAMGKWSAAAAVAVSNRVEGSSYDEDLAWEWLHLRGAGLGGATVAGNLTPGTYSANSEMIPIENRIKRLKSAHDVDSLQLSVDPKQVKGVFAKQIEMRISVRYKGLLSAQTGSWTINPFTGSVFDRIHEARLKNDLSDKLNQRVVGSNVILFHSSGRMTGPCLIHSQIDDTHYLVELDEHVYVLAEQQPDGRFVYDDSNEEEDSGHD